MPVHFKIPKQEFLLKNTVISFIKNTAREWHANCKKE